MSNWKPKEILIHKNVIDDPVTKYFLQQCPEVPYKIVQDGKPTTIVKNSTILNQSENSLLDKIIAGKSVIYIAPATNATVDRFNMPDNRMMCPDFERLKLANNGCFYQCDWCYLKLTYRAAYPFITVRTQYDRIKELLEKRLRKSSEPIIFNSGELADSLALEHLTRAGQEFIPWFAQSPNGYLFMLTKSENVDQILNLPHNKRTIIAWSLNNERVSRKFEIGAPTFERRLEAAHKVQKAGYRVRVRLDPIVPIPDWKNAYAATVKRIFEKLSPERITVGTLRFEEGFHKMRKTIFTSGPELIAYLDNMKPMFQPKQFPDSSRPKSGKYSFTDDERIDIFDFIIQEIRKYSDIPIALCKESPNVWGKLGMDLSRCSCVCQLNYIDMIKDSIKI